MISLYAEHSGDFLRGISLLTLAAFAIPISLAPLATGLLTLVHIVGALQKVQPWTETAEIPFWGGLVILALLFYPQSG